MDYGTNLRLHNCLNIIVGIHVVTNNDNDNNSYYC